MLDRLHDLSKDNKDLLKTTGKCICFHCGHTFNYNADLESTDNGQTVLCPNCSVDSVLPIANSKLVKVMKKQYF